MVTKKSRITRQTDGEIDLEAWYQEIIESYKLDDITLIKNACVIARKQSKGLTTFYGQPCIEKGLEMAEIILDLQLDQKTVAAAIITGSIKQNKIALENTSATLGPEVVKLILGAQKIGSIHHLQSRNDQTRDQTQIDRLRKLLLSMISDIRVVLIKLAERTCIMRGIKKINPHERRRIAQETFDIYAPLANRLGIGQLKWELEDLSFRYINPPVYQTIAKFLKAKRHERELHIEEIIQKIEEKLAALHISNKINGRAKHIYSIYLKKQRKNIDYEKIFDYSAIRILVPTVTDCYAALSVVHSLWQPIPAEFDDYIATPKANGYKSIHTAVIDPGQQNFEIQIRTFDMHTEAERGVAAHWIYKENKSTQAGYEAKIEFLRQLLDWHKEIANQDIPANAYREVLDDRVYVFTPNGDILDLPLGATPLDCAYHLHSELGNRCRGAKINDHIVPLTYTLQTGDRIEILTASNNTPSRDWLNPESGYLKTARARSKVSHWFRQFDVASHIAHGKQIIEHEFPQLNIQKMAVRLHYKDDQTFLAALGRGHCRLSQIKHLLETDKTATKTQLPALKKMKTESVGMTLAGITDLLTRIARCCKPIPGDKIVGFITRGKGVTLHKQDCPNILRLVTDSSDRIMQINWDHTHKGSYYVDVQIKAHHREHLLKEVTTLLSTAKISLVALNSTLNNNNLLMITLTAQINEITQLKELLQLISKLKGVIEAKRVTRAS